MSEVVLTDERQGLIVRPMLTISGAVDLWVDGDLARRGRARRTRDNYRRILDKFADQFPRDWDVSKVRAEDCERFLAQWSSRTRGTQAQVHAPLAGLFRFLYRTRRIKANPMEFVPPVTRSRPEDLDVVTVSADEVRLLLDSCTTWAELLCLSVLAYLGPRRHAVALLRLRDYRNGRIRFVEKGGKVIWKDVPVRLERLIEAAIAAGVYTASSGSGSPLPSARGQGRDGVGSASGFAPDPDAYLIPPEGPLAKQGDRDDRVIWRIVRKVADRAGVKTHVHALRAAFACFYLEESDGDIYSLQELLGHRSLETTRVYLRKVDRRRQIGKVRSLDWGVGDLDAELAGLLRQKPVKA